VRTFFGRVGPQGGVLPFFTASFAVNDTQKSVARPVTNTSVMPAARRTSASSVFSQRPPNASPKPEYESTPLLVPLRTTTSVSALQSCHSDACVTRGPHACIMFAACCGVPHKVWVELRALALLDAMVGPHDLLANVRQLSRFEHGGSLVVAGEGDVVCSTQQVM